MNYNLKDKKITKIAENILDKNILCYNCLGRFFAQIEHGYTNEQRGIIIKKKLQFFHYLTAIAVYNCCFRVYILL